MISRRECLKAMFGAAVAATLAPLVNLTDNTPAFWDQEAIKSLKPWRVSFPDGTVFCFTASVVDEKFTEDGFLLTIRALGPVEILQDSVNSDRTTLQSETTMGELLDLELPSLSLLGEDDLIKRGTMTLSGRFV